MPILSSMDARYFLKTEYNINNLVKLLSTFLPIASNHIFTNINTIEIYEKFIDLFDKNYTKIARLLKIKIPDIKTFEKANYYQSLYELIQEQSEEKYNKPITVKNVYDAFQIFLSNDNFAVFVSSLSYSIISIKNSLTENEELLIKFVSMILIASGHIIVLCISHKYTPNDYDGLFASPLFNECHLFRNNEQDFSLDNLYLEANAYFYIYVSTSSKEFAEIENFNIHDKTPNIQIFHIAQDFDEAFGEQLDGLFEETKEEFPQIDKFRVNKIVITLYNCQLFESNDLQNCWTPYNVSKYSRCFICANEFMEWSVQRVNCFNSLSETKPLFFIDFNEMHYLKIDFHFKNPLYLIGLNDSTMSLINDVYDNIANSTKSLNRLKIKRRDSEKFVEEKLLYAFHKIWKHCISNGKQIRAYPNQIYAVHSAINYINQYVITEDNQHKGCILQVKTGEGKSIIIRALAEIFAKMGKTIHIVSSNIVLSCRDYENSYDYFKSCNFKTAILLHKSEFDDIKCKKKNYFYPSKNEKDFYHENCFDEITDMNIKILEKSKFRKSCDIIFSTFFNLEAWYLRNSEIHPIQANEYFKDCFLIIDEADTILIDEITNGTVIAKDIKSNGIKILEYIYDYYENNILKNERNILDNSNKKVIWLYNYLRSNYPECYDIELDDVQSILMDIESALKYQLNSDYVIERDKKGIGRIIPFDKKQKGIIEREKEFKGFIHQFIGIKESRKLENKNIEIRPLTLNYKFLSHPIFVKMYQGVWGFTGTIGTDEDRNILRKNYNVDMIYIPLHSPNLRKELPSVICDRISDRNKRIIDEIHNFHHKNYPVLVICKDIEELYHLKNMVLSKYDYESCMLVFDGTDLDKSNIEKNSGKKGMITLGTNFCGRGTDIDYNDEYPLHVIVTYGPQNARALYQAYGRTGRNGKAGSSRIICTKNEYMKIKLTSTNEFYSITLNENEIKLQKQFEYFNFFRKSRPWIFNSNEIEKNRNIFSNTEIKQLRKSIINVNRITAANCKYPLCLNIDTFQDIQFQKIYSLKNCPECIYTWFLFQRYINELITQTWSIIIDKITKQYYLEMSKKSNSKNTFISFFEEEYEKLSHKIQQYFPSNSLTTMNETFMTIHRHVDDEWGKKIISGFPQNINDYRFETDASSFLSFKTGFYPYEIKDKSGSRICFIDGSDDDDEEEEKTESNQSIIESIKNKIKNEKMKKINFIEDPELHYLCKDGHFSITYVIDKIFEKICQIIDDQLSNYFGFHFYIRRCFAGCEFGICVDPLLESIDVPFSLIDTKPIFLFAIQCKSTAPLLASILLIVLVFVTIIAVKIAKYLASPGVGITDLLKALGKKLWKAVKNKCKDIVISMVDKISPIKIILEKIIEWLKKQILDLLHDQNDNIALIMRMVLNLSATCSHSTVSDSIQSKIKINPIADNLFSEMSPMGDLIKIGILFALLISAFIKNFKPRHQLKDTASDYQNEFEKNQKNIGKNIKIHTNDDLDNYKSYKETEFDIKIRRKFEDIE